MYLRPTFITKVDQMRIYYAPFFSTLILTTMVKLRCVVQKINKIKFLEAKATYTTTTVATSGRSSPVMDISCTLFSQTDSAVNAPPSDILQDN